MRQLKGRAGASFFIVLLLSVLLIACKSYDRQKEELPDAYDRGTIHISADESFKPIIEQTVEVYESNWPGTHIIVDYKPEAECLKDLYIDSVRMVIVTRKASEREHNFVTDSFGIGLENRVVARDAVAVIMHPESIDSSFTLDEIKAILKGNFNKTLIPVFDGLKATSTVRFIIDSVLHGDSMSKDVRAAPSSQEVIDYISRTKDAVGFVGVSWIANPNDPNQAEFLKKVKIIRLESRGEANRFILPSQQNIFFHFYPLVRDLVYILKEEHKGLGHAYANFLAEEKGQLIFRRAYLSPGTIDLRMRKAVLVQQ
jgi:phosphate transport system substrate-binding protein